MNDELKKQVAEARAIHYKDDIETLSPYGQGDAIRKTLQEKLNAHHNNKLEMDTLPIPFETNTRQRWFDEIVKGKDELLVTVGDSWTWGDSLGKVYTTDGDFDVEDFDPTGEPPPADDYEHRMSSIYGSILADKLDKDFLLIARPAGDNAKMHDNTIWALPYLEKRYKKITVIFCLTELCREIKADPMWSPDNIDDFVDTDSLLKHYEKIMFNSFQTELIDRYPNIQFIFTRNFTYTYKENMFKQHVAKTWMDVLQDNYPQDSQYPDDLRMLSGMAFTPFLRHLKIKKVHSKLHLTMMDQMASALNAEEWMGQNPMQSKRGTRHPLELGHKLWADYLLQHIK